MLFGLTNVSAIYQMLINNTLTKYLNIYTVAYLNDILIYSRNLKDHQKYVENILEQLLIRQLRYKLEKCEFHKKEIGFLGFVVEIDEIKIDPKKIQKILDWPESKNLKNLQRFLRFGNFNRQFISKYLFIILL